MFCNLLAEPNVIFAFKGLQDQFFVIKTAIFDIAYSEKMCLPLGSISVSCAEFRSVTLHEVAIYMYDCLEKLSHFVLLHILQSWFLLIVFFSCYENCATIYIYSGTCSIRNIDDVHIVGTLGYDYWRWCIYYTKSPIYLYYNKTFLIKKQIKLRMSLPSLGTIYMGNLLRGWEATFAGSWLKRATLEL
ncbi:hypothetical protein ACJX0J_018813 [Zea mays]